MNIEETIDLTKKLLPLLDIFMILFFVIIILYNTQNDIIRMILLSGLFIISVYIIDKTNKFTNDMGLQIKTKKPKDTDKKKNENILRLTDLVNEILSNKL